MRLLPGLRGAQPSLRPRGSFRLDRSAPAPPERQASMPWVTRSDSTGYRTCANCRVWASWLKRCQRKPELRLVYRTRQFVAGYVDHGNAARAARVAELGTGLGARRKGYQLLRKPYIRAAIEEMKAAILNRAHQRAEDEARVAAPRCLAAAIPSA